MFYTKFEDKEIPIDSVYARCFKCGKEIDISSELLGDILQDGDLHSTQISCCTTDKPTLTRIK